MLENKLNITNEIELAKEEERITKLKALELFDINKINGFEVGTTKGLCDRAAECDSRHQCCETESGILLFPEARHGKVPHKRRHAVCL